MNITEKLTDIGLDLVKSLLITVVSALIAFFFTKKYYSKVKFATGLKEIGIQSFLTRYPKQQELEYMFLHSDVIKIMFVSGVSFFKTYRTLIEKAVKLNKKVEILIATRETAFLAHIESLEVSFGGRDECKKISDEIDEVMNKLEYLLKDENYCNNIEIRHFSDEYRLPMILCQTYGENNTLQKSDCLLYISLPPYSSRQAAILKLHSDSKQSTDKELDMIEMATAHFDKVWEQVNPKTD
ncbi:MAG: hypothetical protein II896_06505 [Clostridia bacterium]|nr:hypothetical protein [Clostridia bacterium]